MWNRQNIINLRGQKWRKLERYIRRTGLINCLQFQLKSPAITVWHQTAILVMENKGDWHVVFTVFKFLGEYNINFLLVIGQLSRDQLFCLAFICSGKLCVSKSVAPILFHSQRHNGDKILTGVKYHSDKLLSQIWSPACCTCSSFSRVIKLRQLLGFWHILHVSSPAHQGLCLEASTTEDIFTEQSVV